MPDTIALLRGVNVGGHRKLPMATLRAVAEGCGHRAVTTYIQSGNLLFDRAVDDLPAVAEELRAAIERDAGVSTTVVLRTREEWARVAAEHPFAGEATAEKNLCVVFLAGDPDPERVQALLASDLQPEQLQIRGRELYLHYPQGQARTRLNQGVLDRRVGVEGTARNWRTVRKLLVMLG